MSPTVAGLRKALFLLVPAMMALGLDQLTKSLVRAQMPIGQSIPVVPGFFNFTHVINKGGAWSVLNGHVSLLALISIAVSLGILVYVWRKPDMTRWTTGALGILLGGTLGNFFDRLVFGQVTDFLDFYVGSSHFPTFNVADTAINVGVALLLLGSFDEKESPTP